MRSFLIIFAIFVLLFDAGQVQSQTLGIGLVDDNGILGYEAGSKRAPLAMRDIWNNTTQSIDLTELVFDTSLAVDPATMGATVSDESSPYRGKLVSTRCWRAVDGLHIGFDRGFGLNTRGFTIPAGTPGIRIVVFGDIPGPVSEKVALSLKSYVAKYTRQRALPESFAKNDVGQIYRIVPVGSVGFQHIDPISLTLAYQGPEVHAFTITSTTSTGWSTWGTPTWYGRGINFVSTSGGLLPGSSYSMMLKVYDPSPPPPGVYLGSQRIIGYPNTGMCITVPIDVTIQ